jgi:hypothetical protein
MTEFDPTYYFEGDEVYAIHEGAVIASGSVDDMGRVESDALNYLDGLKTERAEKKRKSATHIITPNGVKGKILNRIGGVWGEELSVKFDNGEHATLTVQASAVEWVTEHEKKTASTSRVAALQAQLDSSFDTTRRGLTSRHAQLSDIADECRSLIRMGASYADEVELDRIRLIALGEQQEVQQAIDHIDSETVQPYQAPQPIAIPQADLGRSDSWIDTMVDDMIAESEGNDFNKVLAEDPALVAADLDTPVLADQGASREMALSHVLAKTAGYEGEEVESYRDQFLARFEQARRSELATRKTETHKEAAVAEANLADAPDEALFG